MKIEIDVPDGTTMGDLTTVAGAIFNASAEFVDWEKLHENGNAQDAISAPGRVLLDIAHQVKA